MLLRCDQLTVSEVLGKHRRQQNDRASDTGLHMYTPDSTWSKKRAPSGLMRFLQHRAEAFDWSRSRR